MKPEERIASEFLTKHFGGIKPYWTKRFAKVSPPFELYMLNGTNPLVTALCFDLRVEFTAPFQIS